MEMEPAHGISWMNVDQHQKAYDSFNSNFVISRYWLNLLYFVEKMCIKLNRFWHLSQTKSISQQRNVSYYFVLEIIPLRPP